MESGINNEKNWLEPILCKAFKKLYEKDQYLIEQGKDLFPNEECGKDDSTGKKCGHVSERGIVFRFGIYLQELAANDERLRDYHIDVEYNRELNNVKRGNDSQEPDPKKNQVIPDLIIHKRGNHENNLLVIEFKPHWEMSKKAIEDDKKKLATFTNSTYNYKNVLFVLIGKKEAKLFWDINNLPEAADTQGQ